MKKLTTIVLCLILAVGCFACGGKDETDVPSGDYAGPDYKVQDLGTLYMDAFPDDYCYDWGFSTIYEDGKYKTWWTRPSKFDAIFYAESEDLKNWTNVQRVISLSPNADLKTNYDFIKGMLARPAVLHIGDTYYMYFEAPATENPDLTATVLEWDNNVMLATSKDGIDWEFYADENGQPKPVIQMPDDKMGSSPDLHYYGVGQPSAFYKDGTFYVTYCYVIGNVAEMRVATSTDGKNFGKTETHTSIGLGNGAGVTYNEKTGKYLMVQIYGDDYYILESDSPTSWPTRSSGDLPKRGFKITDNANDQQYCFPGFVTNPEGRLSSETFYVLYSAGRKADNGDWRQYHETWDGHAVAVNPREYMKKDIVLPDGKTSNEEHLKAYADRSTKLPILNAEAKFVPAGTDVVVDGKKDAIYEGAEEIKIERGVYSWGSNITPTTGSAWVVWDKDYLYYYVEIKDDVIDTKNELMDPSAVYRQDSLDVFVDVPNKGTTEHSPYGNENYVISISAKADVPLVIKGRNESVITSRFAGDFEKSIKTTREGYIIEAKVAWYSLVKTQIVGYYDQLRADPDKNVKIGLDFQINDARGLGDREAMVAWSDHTGEAFRYTDRLGNLYLKL